VLVTTELTSVAGRVWEFKSNGDDRYANKGLSSEISENVNSRNIHQSCEGNALEKSTATGLAADNLNRKSQSVHFET
jgi:hypothetical protein